jgi:hypothetical protein
MAFGYGFICMAPLIDPFMLSYFQYSLELSQKNGASLRDADNITSVSGWLSLPLDRDMTSLIYLVIIPIDRDCSLHQRPPHSQTVSTCVN